MKEMFHAKAPKTQALPSFYEFLCTFAPLRENTFFPHGPETEFRGLFRAKAGLLGVVED